MNVLLYLSRFGVGLLLLGSAVWLSVALVIAMTLNREEELR